MTTYKDSGVDIKLGDKCSEMAYNAAKKTFIARKGMIGEPVLDEGGFSGTLDMGDFYLLQNCDGVGSKAIIAEQIEKYDTLGFDLLAMVADDAACLGAETISITNTIDVNVLNYDKIADLISGLETACLKHKIVMPGGEIAELNTMLNNYIWNSTALGIVEKDRIITCKNIEEGDKIIGLKSAGLRSNGYSLVRRILEKEFGQNWYQEKFNDYSTWGEAALTPSIVYCSAIMDLHGRFKEQPKVKIKGIAHITGGGLPGNISRVLKKKGLGAKIDDLPVPHEIMIKLMELGKVEAEEAYRTWNMGVGMILVCNEFEQVAEICKRHNIEAQIIGEVQVGDLQIEFPKI